MIIWNALTLMNDKALVVSINNPAAIVSANWNIATNTLTVSSAVDINIKSAQTVDISLNNRASIDSSSTVNIFLSGAERVDLSNTTNMSGNEVNFTSLNAVSLNYQSIAITNLLLMNQFNCIQLTTNFFE